MSLDFSGLTDDQLVELVREACHEAIRRNPGLRAAVENVMLDEAEKARVAKEATERAAAAMRARERERIAAEAAAAVREKAERESAPERARRAMEEGRKAAEAARAAEASGMNWLRRAAILVNRRPSEISILYVSTKFGTRAMINIGAERHTRDHLADYNSETKVIKTPKELIKAKPALASLMAEFTCHYRPTTHITGEQFEWPEGERA